MISLFGPTHIAWTRTYHPQAIHMQRPVPCGPCQRPVCPEGHHRCMRELSPESVIQAALGMLGQKHGSRATLGNRRIRLLERAPDRPPYEGGTQGGSGARPTNDGPPGDHPPSPPLQGGEIFIRMLRVTHRLASYLFFRDWRPRATMTTWLITGATGFLGRHVLGMLDDELARTDRSDDRVFVLGRRCPAGWPEDRFVSADLDDPDGLREAIGTVAPDQVIHTAGQTPPAADEALYRGNFWATIRLLNALRSLNRPIRVTLAGSAAELGAVPPAELPVAESHPCNPVEAYGRSKWMATVAGLAERPPLEVSVARVFNPIGPGLPPTQAFGEFASQLLATGSDPLPLVVGNLEIAPRFHRCPRRGRGPDRSGPSRPVGTGLPCWHRPVAPLLPRVWACWST